MKTQEDAQRHHELIAKITGRPAPERPATLASSLSEQPAPYTPNGHPTPIDPATIYPTSPDYASSSEQQEDQGQQSEDRPEAGNEPTGPRP